MGYLLKSSSTAKPLIFLMIDSTDHVTGKTGLTPTVTLSKNGAAFASPAGSVTEIANGFYKVAGNATDTGTLGPLMLHATASGADPTDETYTVVAFDPDTAYAVAGTQMDLVNAPNATGAAALAAALLDLANGIETSWTPRQLLRSIGRILLSKSSNGGTTFRDLADSKDAITSTADSSGNRTAVTIDKT